MGAVEELTSLARGTVGLLRRSWGTDHPIDLLRVAATKLIRGHPVAVSQIASTIGAPAAGVGRMLRQVSDATWTADGRLTGLLVTATPTPYRLSIANHRLYATGAFDAILVSALLAEPINLVTSCHVTGTPIRVDVHADGRARAVPRTTVVAILTHPERFATLHAPMCPYQVTFRSSGVATDWLRAHPNHGGMTVRDACRFARLLAITRTEGSMVQT